MLARFAGRVTIDLGTGDGRLPWALARETPERLFIGLDANAAGLRERSRRAARGAANLLYVRAAVEDLPSELGGVADRLIVLLPWGSLLAAVAKPSVEVLRGVRALCQPAATLTVVLGVHPARDRAEALRLGLPALDTAHTNGPLREGYAEAGFAITAVRDVGSAELLRWPSTWARRLAFEGLRSALVIEAWTRRG